MHISLGKFKPTDKPPCFVEDTVVSFSIEKFSTIPTNWPDPMLIPGQREFKLLDQAGQAILRHFATQWYFVDIVVNDFDFKFKMPPHISLACYGLMYVPEEKVKVGKTYEYGKTKL